MHLFSKVLKRFCIGFWYGFAPVKVFDAIPEALLGSYENRGKRDASKNTSMAALVEEVDEKRSADSSRYDADRKF